MSEKNHGCSYEVQDIRLTHKHDRFDAWQGKDGRHQDLSVQVRLESNGDVFLSTQQGHVTTLQLATVSLPELHAAIKSLIETANGCGAPRQIFTVTPEERGKIEAFKAAVEQHRGSNAAGAIGGSTTYSFTPTSLGTIFKVTHFDEELDLTDYDSW